MEEVTYSIELSDGTKLENLRLNGNNFVSETEVTADVFEGNLDTVVITHGEDEETMQNAELLQITHGPDGWYFILREIPAEQQRQMDIDALTVDHELRLTMLELGIN